MPVLNRVAELHEEVTGWRREIHSNPELLYDVHETAAKVADLLKGFGVDEIVTGIGQTGVVGIINGNKTNSGKTIGLRADMDALPIIEETGKEYASKIEGKMHACGHDGHTAMLLGAAKYLSETRNFNGRVALIFQPAEEGGAGGKAMVDDGMMDRFNINEVYGMHNMPDLPVGQFAMRPGTLLASADLLQITMKGKGGHAAKPHECVDPIVAASAAVQAIQSFASRNVDPLNSVVVSITQFHAGTAFNIIPQEAHLSGTVRCLDEEVRTLVEKRVEEIVSHVALAHGCTADVKYERMYPPTVNHVEQVNFAGEICRSIAGDANVDMNTPPVMGGEDFSFMLEARPGAFIYVGNGDSAGLHHPAYDFNDEAIPHGISFFAELVHKSMPA
ncbi:N-acetyl-L,L-diaminopimelate deacetylase [hydrothermal vent metagenome]|uniref:N-acetyl-L,L-diaminopimelate deacetylase n=1 Tax=hydrothermal vent metagenome TaxID=652676 RepID=A0A3B0S9K3_9ZZZZ